MFEENVQYLEKILKTFEDSIKELEELYKTIQGNKEQLKGKMKYCWILKINLKNHIMMKI